MSDTLGAGKRWKGGNDRRRAGGRYAALCRRLGGPGADPEARLEAERRIARLEERAGKLAMEKHLRGLAGDTAASVRSGKMLARAERELDRARRVCRQRKFRHAMDVTGMGLEPEQVVRFSGILALISALVGLVLSLGAGICLGLDMSFLSVAVILGAVALPLGVFTLTAGYPERLAARMETEAMGAAPEAINYMVMSMELSPSLDRALRFAAGNVEGPMARDMRALLWKIHTRKYANTEAALMDYARGLRGRNEDMRSAIYNLLGAARESDPETMRSSLGRASDLVLAGTRQRVEEFAASLGTPAMILFSLGILMPMIIGTLLPMMSMGGLGTGALGLPSPSDTGAAGGWTGTFIGAVLLMDIAFPAVALVYASHILARRPGIHTAVPPGSGRASMGKLAGGIITAGAFCIAGFALAVSVNFWGMEDTMGITLALAGVALGAGIVLAVGPGPERERRRVEALEEQMPDMLFHLGSNLTEGAALEVALEETALAMEGTEMGDFLANLLEGMKRSGSGPAGMLLAGDGPAGPWRSSGKLRATMRLAIVAAGKDPAVAGRMLMTISGHMRELANTDREMRLKLRSTIESMKNTAVLFAPVIMGVTVGLYRLLAVNFGRVGTAPTMPEYAFAAVMGVYLMLTVALTTYFSSGIERGAGHWRGQLAWALPVSAAVYALSAAGALMAFG